ncbi:MAG: TATA-box-binding protein [Thermoplasmatota archaeon]
MVEIKVENMVASASLGKSFDLERVVEALEGAEYDPDKFKGVIFKIRKKDLKTSVLLFNSGKIVCTGATLQEDIEKTIILLKKLLTDEGIEVNDDVNLKIQNIVGTTDLGHSLNLNSVAIAFGLEKIEYEPEQFPGLVYRMDEPKLVMLFFGSGKVVCTGGKNTKEMKEGVEKVRKELINTGFLPDNK